MNVLGLQGSPRKDGNTAFLLEEFLRAARDLGARTTTLEVDQKEIVPCKEYIVCEKKGFCPIADDMKREIYFQLRAADVVVMATPIFFYNTPAQLKALIDRCQVFWARRYRLGLTDPAGGYRKGFLLALGATRGKNLFDGVTLTARYFFDALSAEFSGQLTYRQIEKPGDMAAHPSVRQEVRQAAETLLRPLQARQRILFACRENAGRSQMAAAFAQHLAGDRVAAASGGSQPAEKINPLAQRVMQEKGIDLGFRRPRSLEAAIEEAAPEIVVTMGCGEACPLVPGARVIDWELPDPAGQPLEMVRALRDDIEARVRALTTG